MVASNGHDSSPPPPSYDRCISNGPSISVSPPPPHGKSDNGLDEARKNSESSELIQVRITCPNLGQKVSKMFHFALHETVWVAKLNVLTEFSVNPNLQDALNFGFYLPPHAGRAGKFLDEQRRLREYPMDNVEAHLEFRYKRRIFRHLYTPDEKKLLKVNSKKYRKKFMELVTSPNIDEMTKFLDKGLDPNYHDEKTGNTPLIAASMSNGCLELLKVLVQYGAYLDFRTAKGETALHIAAASGKLAVLKDFASLGASPNYHDAKGLTPLYHSILNGTDLSICEHLLKSGTIIGVSDIHGSEEIHQACKLGYWKHLEMLILHGAKVNSCTASGNTPLHICALENQVRCAQLLLSHGANMQLQNYAQQSPYDVSVLTGHADMATLLQSYRPKIDDMGGVNVKQNNGTMRRLNSLPTLPTAKNLTLNVTSATDSMPRHNIREDADDMSGSDSESEDEDKLGPVKQVRTFSSGGVGTKRSPAPMKIKTTNTPILRKRLYPSPPGKKFVVTNDYRPAQSGELSLKKGDFVEVLYVGDNGFWEGHIGDRGGWFPSYCVQEVKHSDNPISKQINWLKKSSTEEVNKAALAPPTPRTVTLRRSEKGFGFQLKGANSHVPFIDFVPTPQYPALQYIGQVDIGSIADKAGLSAGDFVLSINNENVVNATHGYSVSLISKCTKSLTMTVVAVAPDMDQNTITTTAQMNMVEVRDDSKKLADIKPPKPGPPTPPMRSFSTTLSKFNSDTPTMFSGTPVITRAETVALSSTVNRKPSVKGIWSGNAYRLQGSSTVNIRDDDISRGIARRQKTMSQVESGEKSPTKMIAVNSCLGLNEMNSSAKISRTSSFGKLDNVEKPTNFVRSMSNGTTPTEYNQQLEDQQYATIRKHNQQEMNKPSPVNKPPDVAPKPPKESPIVFDFNTNTPVSNQLHQSNQRRDYMDYEYVIAGDIHQRRTSETSLQSSVSEQESLPPPDFPASPETDGLVRLQNQRHNQVPGGKAPGMYNSNSSVSSDSKDSGYDASETETSGPKLTRGGTLEATACLDNVIANAEASLNFDLISIASSTVSHDTESDSAVSPRSPTLGMIDFPPPPTEFLADDDTLMDNSSLANLPSPPPTPNVSPNTDPPAPSLLRTSSDPPPPYTPYMNAPSESLNVPDKLAQKSFMEWSCDEVCSWLEHLSLGQYKDTFVSNEIEGKHLPELSKDELKELGVTKLGHRMTLDDQIGKLKSTVSP